MNAVTQCPTCNTRFKVTQSQLDARQGLVRCGHCQAVFNATAQLHDDQPSPQLDLPITAEEAPQGLLESASSTEAELAFSTDGDLDFSRVDSPHTETETAAEITAEIEPQPGLHANGHGKCTAPDNETRHARSPLSSSLPQTGERDKVSLREFHVNEFVGPLPAHEPPEISPESAEPLTQTPEIILAHDLDEAPAVPPKKKRAWPWAIGSALLLIMLLGQAAYFFRIELAARLPGLKPTLISYCSLLGCTVPLPQKADLMSIESSDLEIADPTLANVITLNAILRNRAPYPQAYPNLELTLTDTEEKAVARRIFRPAEYLKPGEDENQGLAANRELNVKLNLDTTNLMASGYRLFLFYPQH